ncbi:MAG: hypothetical protein ACLQPV_11025, partial [Vulcanimicrobiaceae bacterium]
LLDHPLAEGARPGRCADQRDGPRLEHHAASAEVVCADAAGAASGSAAHRNASSAAGFMVANALRA